MNETVTPDDPGREVRQAALDMALRHHGHSETPAAARTIVVTAKAFEEFLNGGGLLDIAEVARDRKNP